MQEIIVAAYSEHQNLRDFIQSTQSTTTSSRGQWTDWNPPQS